MDNIQLTPEMLALVPIVALLIQLLKNLPLVAKILPYLPFISIVIAYVLAIIQLGTANWQVSIIPAIAVGLIASGAYDAVKAITPAKTTPPV